MKIFSVEILQVKYIPHRFLFDDEQLQEWIKSDQIDTYNVYFITRSKKIRFDLSRTSTNMLGNLKTWVRIGDSKEHRITTTVHHCNPILFNLLDNHSLLTQVGKSYRIDRTNSDDRSLIVQVDVGDGVTFPLAILIESVFLGVGIELDVPPEIVYIGQSFRIIDRLQSHKRINQTASLLRDDEELRVNLIQFKLGYGGGSINYNDKAWGFFLRQHDSKTQEFRDKISLIERFLISFFKPTLNDQHINTPFHEDRLVREIINKYSVEGMALGVGVHGAFGKFWSKNQVLNNELSSYNFNNPKLGFQSNLDAIIKEWF